MSRSVIADVAQELYLTKQAVALTGAGMSVESGIPPYRGPGGIWTKRAKEYGDVRTFRKDPAKAWIHYRDILGRTLPARPHKGHSVLTWLEKAGFLNCTITQNIDRLHQKAGSRNVIELHGNNLELRCSTCGKCYESRLYWEKIPPLCGCGGYLRPTFVLYGESILPQVWDAAQDSVRSCRMLFVIGTSGLVFPTNALPYLADRVGAHVVAINTEETEISGINHRLLRGEAGTVLEKLRKHLKQLMKMP